VDQRKLKRQRKMKFMTYYQGTFFGKSSAQIMYSLCQQLNRETRELLWCWIVGMSDLIVNSRSGTYDYDDDISKCNDEV
jgi:CDC45-like protein